MKKSLALVFIAAAAVSLSSCGDNKKSAARALLPEWPNLEHLASFPYGADSLLPAASGNVTITVAPTILRPPQMTADTADTNTGYLCYDVVGVASASYTIDSRPLAVEIAQFAKPIDAYGYYAARRPNGVPTELIGRQSFRLGSTRYVFVGDYALTLTAADTAAEDLAVLDQTARSIAERVTVQTAFNSYHILFPGHDRVAGSDRYYGYQFAGIPSMNAVYTMDFAIGADTTTWFISPDSSGGKFLLFKDWLEDDGEPLELPFIFTFDEGFSVYVEHPRFGRVVAGLVSGKLVGVLDYRPEMQEQKTAAWIKGLK